MRETAARSGAVGVGTPAATVLAPAGLLGRGNVPGSLRRWLAKGDSLPAAAPGRETQLRSVFAFSGAGLPAAALTRSQDARDAAATIWLRADPCYVIADAVTVRMLSCSDLQLSSEESARLVQALQPLFGDAGFPLDAPVPERWYLRCPGGSDLPDFAPPDQVLGADLLQHLPSADRHRRWRHLLNEAQIILHNHPINAQRTRSGRLPVNSVWFWGAGSLPDWARSDVTRVISADPVVQALARLAGADANTAVSEVMPSESGDHWLIDLNDAQAQDVQACFERLDEALTRRRIATVCLHVSSGERFAFRPRHRWRFWRRTG